MGPQGKELGASSAGAEGASSLDETEASGLGSMLVEGAEGVADDLWDAGPDENSYGVFMPKRVGVYLERFAALAARLHTERGERAAYVAVQEEAEWARTTEEGLQQRALTQDSTAAILLRRYRAALGILGDLLAQGWAWRYRDHRLELAPPDFTSTPKSNEEILRQKDAIRASMHAERVAQLRSPSTRRFIDDMERPRKKGSTEYSVLNLVADGVALAEQLKEATRFSGEGRDEYLAGCVQPYLQMAEGEDRCSETGFRLIDIWRYFRYFWSLPYFSTPGRNIFYLVRDRARRFHPVIGIAALGNSFVQLRDRDERIGWTIDAFLKRFGGLHESHADQERQAEAANSLRDAIESALAQVDTRGLLTDRECANPTEKVISRLLNRARSSAERRIENLRTHDRELRTQRERPKRTRPLDPSQTMLLGARKSTSAVDRSVEDLYDRKRAEELADLLHAKFQFAAAGIHDDPAAALRTLLSREDGRRAAATALRAIKKTHIGSSMMDIIICGAIPPYSHVLGGKLVAMLLTSSEVRLHYRNKYAEAASEIASKMKGERVSRAADLVFLGTTSLYHAGSSQYNRVRIPASIVGGVGQTSYEKLGHTRGFGSVHFSEPTRVLLETIAREDKGATLITRTFGEGVNPKLRQVREGLSCIGLDHSHFLQHRCRRIIYGVALAGNASEYLRGEAAKPAYYFPGKTKKEATACTDAISRFWATRWLSSRLNTEGVLGRVALTTDRELRMSLVADRGLGSSLAPPDQERARRVSNHAAGKFDAAKALPLAPPPSAGPLGVAFVQKLYNSESCYADRLTPEQLDAIHIRTPLEDFVLSALRERKDVVLTGNPGDGKTHLLMRLQKTLDAMKVDVHLDATAEESYEALIEKWNSARRKKRPFCLAINEWPLMELTRGFKTQFQPLSDIQEQIEGGIVYEDAKQTRANVVVVDLNNRNVVEAHVFKQLVSTLIDDRFYPECSTCPARSICDVPKARHALQRDRVRERLFSLLELVAKRGHHITVRDLQGFLAYLITGGRSCEQLIASAHTPSPYYELVFRGESDLFDSLRETFDPARVTHPTYDEALWTGTLSAKDWADPTTGTSLPPSAAPTDKIEAMRGAKRRFFFEHAAGADLLRMLPQDERKFYEILDAAPEHSERVIRELVRLVNRFFDPRCEIDTAVRLWTRHSYDARWSPAYVSVRSVPALDLVLRVPKLNPRAEGAFGYQADHVVLAAEPQHREVASLLVDLTLIKALLDAQRGLPIALRPAEVLKRLDMFFDQLGAAYKSEQKIEDVHIKNFETGAEMHFKVDRQKRKYMA